METIGIANVFLFSIPVFRLFCHYCNPKGKDLYYSSLQRYCIAVERASPDASNLLVKTSVGSNDIHCIVITFSIALVQ